MAKFQKGNPGRPQGATNKAGGEIKQRINDLFDASFTLESIQSDLAELAPKERLKFMADLMPYVVPKLQNTTYTGQMDFEALSDDQLDRMIERFVLMD